MHQSRLDSFLSPVLVTIAEDARPAVLFAYSSEMGSIFTYPSILSSLAFEVWGGLIVELILTLGVW